MPLVENSPRTELELKASLEMSAAVWLDPMDLTESIILEQSTPLCSNSDESELLISF